MASAQERMQILKMIEEGKISAKEGAELLRALDKTAENQTAEPTRSGNPRWLRVRVTDVKNGRDRVNVNIPMGLVKVGMRMGARFAPEIEGEKFATVIAEAIRTGQQGKVLDIDDTESGERVEIFVE